MAGDSKEDGNQFTRRQIRLVTVWSVVLLTALVASMISVAKVAMDKPPLEAAPPSEGKDVVVVNVDREVRSPEPSSPAPAAAQPHVLLDLDVSAVAGPFGEGQAGGSRSGAGSGGGATQRVDINVGGASASSQPSAVAGRTGASRSSGGEAVGSPCEARCVFCKVGDGDSEKPSNPCAVAKHLGRVEFETGRRRILASHAQRLEEIADEFAARHGVLLVIGHTDSCGGSRLARHRARKVRRALRELLVRRSSWKGWGHADEIRIHSQAAGEDPKAPEGSCDARYYGSAGVYLIEGLK